jgi:hypothetical protein
VGLTLDVLLGPLNGKSKEKEKEPTRQSTLFGLPLGPPMEKPEKRGRKKKVTEESSQSQTPEGGSKTSTPTPEVAPVPSTQASDVTMAEVETLVETQQLEEAYETQVESQDVHDDMNEVCLFFIAHYCLLTMLGDAGGRRTYRMAAVTSSYAERTRRNRACSRSINFILFHLNNALYGLVWFP